MNSTESAIQQVNSFFDEFSHALQRFDTKAMAFLYNMPCTLLADESTTPFTNATKLEGFFNQGASAYRQFGITNVRHEVWTKHRWTDKMVLVKVKWYYSNAKNELVYSCDYQYIMKTDKNNQLKIAMSISLNEKEQMEEWKKRVGYVG